MSRRALLVVLLAAPLGGCAHGPARRAAKTPSPPVASPELTGVWDWVASTKSDQGDLRVEQEEWHLKQDGHQIHGYYDRQVTMMSTDDTLFRCNQKLGFVKQTRVKVSGMVLGEQLVLEETAFEAKPGPCDDGARNLVKYVGTLKQGTIRLQWANDAYQTLYRRAGVADPGDVEPAGAVAAGEDPGVHATVPIDGTWEWELRSIDAEGDERVEHEEWHLAETGDGIAGYYERRVTRVRGDGKFSCNSSEKFETVTRYTIAGQRLGDRLQLAETKYEVPSGPKPCDNGQRRLDKYRGSVSPDGLELTLSWGPGNQLLRKQR
jgi:hypothetical protein